MTEHIDRVSRLAGILLAAGALLVALLGIIDGFSRRQSSDGQPTPGPGGCTPQTCETLGHACGTAQDGCGGLVSCGSCGAGEMCSSGTCIDTPVKSPPPPRVGTPYRHVVPSDVGKTIGVGVVAPVPTKPYTGPDPITQDGTTIENVTFDYCPKVRADNTTFRNVIVDCSDHFGIDFTGASNVRVEYSQIFNDLDGKAILIEDGTNLRFEHNDISGGQDWFYLSGKLDEIYVENNYLHHVVGGAEAHTDGFQWDGSSSQDVYIRGNYMTLNNPGIGVTDALFLTDPTAKVRFENNYVGLFGYYTIRCQGCSGELTIQDNIYAQEFKTAFPAPGAPTHAILYEPLDPGRPAVYRCNRYEDGSFIEQRYVDDGNYPLKHDITGCPSYP